MIQHSNDWLTFGFPLFRLTTGVPSFTELTAFLSLASLIVSSPVGVCCGILTRLRGFMLGMEASISCLSSDWYALFKLKKGDKDETACDIALDFRTDLVWSTLICQSIIGISTKAWRGHFPMNLHMQYHQLDPQLAMMWTWNANWVSNLVFPSCPIGDLIGYEVIYFNRKLHMLLDMEMNLPGFRTYLLTHTQIDNQ